MHLLSRVWPLTHAETTALRNQDILDPSWLTAKSGPTPSVWTDPEHYPRPGCIALSRARALTRAKISTLNSKADWNGPTIELPLVAEAPTQVQRHVRDACTPGSESAVVLRTQDSSNQPMQLC